MTDGIAPEDFSTLLQLQKRDSEIDQLRHRREHLPAHETLAAIQAEAAGLKLALTQAVAEHDEQLTRQQALESEVATAQLRVESINARMYGTTAIAPKDAQAMSEEVKHLQKRMHDLEDDELEVMEKLEPLTAHRRRLEAKAQELAARMHAAQSELRSGQSELDERLGVLRVERESILHEVPVQLINEYDRLRAALGGVAVAEVTGNACGGCHLTLSATEIDQIRKAPPSDILHCEECGRILVR